MIKEKPHSGLSADEVQKRFVQFGPNSFPEPKPPTLLFRFLSQFHNALMLLLLGAGVVSLLIGETLDATFILVIVFVNASFGVFQEYKAERALSALKTLTITMVRVFRDGKETRIDSKGLVPDDIIVLEEGDKIPADCMMLEAFHVEVNESALTGESMSVSKSTAGDDASQLFLGTTMAHGRALVQVTKTGISTKFGSIAATLASMKTTNTPLQVKLETFTKRIGVIGILAAVIVFILSFSKGNSMLESFLFAISLAIAAVPEGLPAVMTIVLALGVERMAKRGAIVRRLAAIETLGSVTVVATDKTGTITTNKMAVKKIWIDGSVYSFHEKKAVTHEVGSLLLTCSIVCSTASLATSIDEKHDPIVIGDTTEGAVLLYAHNHGMDVKTMRSSWLRHDEISFSSLTKRMSVIVSKKNDRYVFTKGAPESVLDICTKIATENGIQALTDKKKHMIIKEFEVFARLGLRMMAFSYKKDGNMKMIESEQVFLGFVGIADPVREQVPQAVSRARQAGIRTLMITGDNALTAEAVGIESGIITKGDTIISSNQIKDISDNDLSQILLRVSVFARMTPDDKLRIVRLLQESGETVAVTGDGVNDVLALKKADIGIAMGKTGTDVSKETADMVITDDNFATIIHAVEEGRSIFRQIKNAIMYLLACNFGEVLYILPATFFNIPVLTPLQILYMNIVTDGLPAISLAFIGRDPRVMSEKPRKGVSILDIHDTRYIVILGIATAVFGFISIFMGDLGSATLLVRTTAVFTVIMLVQHFILMDIWFVLAKARKTMSLLMHPVFLVAVLLPFILYPFMLYVPTISNVFETAPLSLMYFSQLLLLSLGVFVVTWGLRRVKK